MRIWNTRCKSFVILGEITCPRYMPTCFHVLQISDKSRSKNRLHQGIASIMIYPLHVRTSTSISQKTISRRNMIPLLSSPTCFCQWRILLPHCKCILQIFAHLSWHRRILDKVSLAESVQKSYPLQYSVYRDNIFLIDSIKNLLP